MFDNYIFTENTFRNVESNGKVLGFELKTLIPYYRGIPYSMIHDIRVSVDGTPVEREKIRFSADGEDWFTPSELETVTTYKWEYGTQGTICVDQPGGLAQGKHEVTLTVVIRVAYIPVPFEGVRTREVIV
jgi:hypothetical protein